MNAAMNNVNNRNVGLDILRVILAFLVVGIHIIAPATGAVGGSVEWSVTKFFVSGLTAICYPAVNTYVILSGFLAFAHKKSIYGVVKSLTKLWLCLMFFSILGLIVGSFYYNHQPSLSTIISRLFPLCSGEWWYMTNYFVLMLMSPMLNKLIDQYSEKSIFYTLCGTLMICTIVPFFLKYNDFIGLNIGYGLIWFVVLYCTGAFLYKIKDMIKRISSSKYILSLFIMVFIYVALNSVLNKFEITKGFGFSAYNSVLVYLESILLFCGFYTLRVSKFDKYANVISWLGGISFASYIFHCQADFGPILWEITQPSKFANSLLLIPIVLFIILGVFIVSVLLEQLRRQINKVFSVERRLSCFVDRIFPKELL